MKHKGFVPKGWGSEFIWSTTDKYCCKFLNFNTGNKFSMHFHALKDESWFVMNGKFLVRWVDTISAARSQKELNKGDVWHNAPLVPHQLICLEAGTIIEVSTPDSVEDNYRIEPGDSQTTTAG